MEQNLIVQGIIDAEGLSLNDKETEDLKNNLLADYGVESIDELIEAYGEDEVNESLALLRVEKFIVEQSTVNEKTGSAEDPIENEDAYSDAKIRLRTDGRRMEATRSRKPQRKIWQEKVMEDDTVEWNKQIFNKRQLYFHNKCVMIIR